MKVLFRFDAGAWIRHHVKSFEGGGLSIAICGERDDEAYHSELADSDALWHVLRPVTSGAMAGAPKLRLIQKIGVGVNTIDLAAARARGIAVCNMPGTNSRAVAELALLLMLSCLRRAAAFDPMVRAGNGWAWPVGWQDGLREIAGRTVGLVGFGSTPRLLAPVLTAMGATVIYTNRTRYEDVPYAYVAKDELLARSDIVSLHIPMTEETASWLDARAIARMKPGSIVINVARGALIDEAALLAALDGGHVAGAGLDVFCVEPAAADNPLFARNEVVVTPHVAWLTRETLVRSIAVAAENCRRLAAGEPLLHRVA